MAATATATGLDGRGIPAPAAEIPPAPRLAPLLVTAAWAISPTWVLDRCASAIGEWFTLKMFPSGIEIVMVSDPDAIKSLLTAPAELAPSGAAGSPIASVMGPSSVVILTGPEHMRQRKLLLPPFHGERMREYEEVIVEATRRDMARWPIGAEMRMRRHSQRITLEVILRAVFGVEAERMEPLRAAIEGLTTPLNNIRLLRLALSRPRPGRPTGAFGDALDRLDALIYEELARRRSEDLGDRADILSLLLQARDEECRPMSDAELRDELITLLLAGHETTATSVAWAIERLVRHPAKLERLLAEIDRGERDDYLMAVVNETLRVRPVVPVVVRVLTEDMELGGRLLPAGTRVAPNIYLANRNPRIYDAPAEFIPERFLDSTPETFSWIPFGGGIRRCIGASFAILEMKLILRTALAELRPELPRRLPRPARRRCEHIRRRAITLVPSQDARVVWRLRRAGTADAQ
jgi:cytochrome P450 family 135